ncbi:MAG: hypothetical protein RR621_03445 [Lachnospiraceae bacterium]
MQRILKEEICRAFCGVGMKISLAVGMVISLAHVLQYGLANHSMLQSLDFTKVSILHPIPVVEGWMAGNTYNLESFIYFLLLPLLATIPFGLSYFDEKTHGVLHNMFMRVSRKQYFIAKYAATFLSGGTAIIIPLLANLLLTMLLLPNHVGTNILTGNSIDAAKIGYELYFNHPGAYLGCYFILDFLLGGVFACAALVGSYVSAYRIVNAIIPFFLQLAIYVACSIVGKEGYTSIYFAQAGYGIYMIWIPLAYIIILGGDKM